MIPCPYLANLPGPLGVHARNGNRSSQGNTSRVRGPQISHPRRPRGRSWSGRQTGTIGEATVDGEGEKRAIFLPSPFSPSLPLPIRRCLSSRPSLPPHHDPPLGFPGCRYHICPSKIIPFPKREPNYNWLVIHPECTVVTPRFGQRSLDKTLKARPSQLSQACLGNDSPMHYEQNVVNKRNGA